MGTIFDASPSQSPRLMPAPHSAPVGRRSSQWEQDTGPCPRRYLTMASPLGSHFLLSLAACFSPASSATALASMDGSFLPSPPLSSLSPSSILGSSPITHPSHALSMWLHPPIGLISNLSMRLIPHPSMQLITHTSGFPLISLC